MRLTNCVLILALISILLILPSISCSALTKAKGSLGGTVYVNGRPEANCTVQVFTPEDAYIKQIRCNNTGHYTLKDLDPGPYVIRVLNSRGIAYDQDTSVQVRLGRFETVDIKITIEMGGL